MLSQPRKDQILLKLAEVIGGYTPTHEGSGGKVVKMRGSIKDTDGSIGTERLKSMARKKKITAAHVAKAGKISRTWTPADGGMGT
jgi:hypothetical protein